MISKLKAILQSALDRLVAEGILASQAPLSIDVARPGDAKHGDYASAIALRLANAAAMNPRDLAQKIIDALPASPLVDACTLGGPGFINFRLSMAAKLAELKALFINGEAVAAGKTGQRRKIHLAFVCAHPTGPLPVGYGASAVSGSVLAKILEAAGYDVSCEYYVNDAGRHMDILATSVWLRYLELCGEALEFPSNAYDGDYVFDIGADMHRAIGDQARQCWSDIIAGVPADQDEHDNGDNNAPIDGLIAAAKKMLTADGYRRFYSAALNAMMEDIRRDLREFGVNFQQWFFATGLCQQGAVESVVHALNAAGQLYQKDGHWWLKSAALGDEKDRIVQRADGSYSEYALDIAYHRHKLQCDCDQFIEICSADNHAYVAGLKAAMAALGVSADKWRVELLSFSELARGKETISLTALGGDYVTLRQLRMAVGSDAARFFYVSGKDKQRKDFAGQVASAKSNDNPLYYIQYAHARICGVLRKLQEKGMSLAPGFAEPALSLLAERREIKLIDALARYGDTIESAARAREPRRIARYLREVAMDFHAYYTAHRFLVDDEPLRNARLSLIQACRQVLCNGLTILGISAPESM